MLLARSFRRFLLLSLLLGLLSVSRSAVAEPPLPLDLDDARSSVAIGEELERAGQWLDAVKHYDRALERWPADTDLEYCRRRARVHFRIEKRYSDRSFRDSLRAMPRTEAIGLFRQTADHIRQEFIDSLDHRAIIAHGTESLYYALVNPRFLEVNFPNLGTDPSAPQREAIRTFRKTLKEQYWNYRVFSSEQAVQAISDISSQARRTLQLSESAVVMEYIFGSCNALDDYSGFLTPDRLADLRGNINGEFVGLGVEMKEESGRGMRLVNVLPESPASSGGLQRGDYIVGIDGIDVRQLSIDEAASMMRGAVGSRVRLRVSREADAREWDSILIRRAVHVKSIPEAKIVDRDYGIGYVQLQSFQRSTVEELDLALSTLQRQGLRALILDVRRNPGGLMDTAVEVLERFIDRGVLVETRSRTPDQNQVYQAQSRGALSIPLVLLTDGESASASEIVAGAIKDHHRGTLVGRKTFGKWSVQSIFNLDHGAGLRLTTAKFYSPNGHTLGKIGVEPDVLVEKPVEHNVAFRGRNAGKDSNEPDLDLDKGLEILRRELGR